MTCSEAMRITPLAGFAAVAGLLATACLAQAQPVQVVNVCGSDDAGGGLNLATALAQGGSITIQYPAGQTEIQFTQTRNLAAAVAILGEGEVTLRGTASGPMFTTSRTLRLSKLTLVNNAAVTGSIVSGTVRPSRWNPSPSPTARPPSSCARCAPKTAASRTMAMRAPRRRAAP